MEQFNTETRCRRCGGLNDYWGGQASREDYDSFRTASLAFYQTVERWLQVPRLEYCENCRKSTVQDVVSYTPFPEIK